MNLRIYPCSPVSAVWIWQRNGPGSGPWGNANGRTTRGRYWKSTGRGCQDGGIYVSLQQMTFLDEPVCGQSHVFRGGSHANRTALQESVRRLVTSVISGRKCGELLAKLSQDGLWLKTFGDCFQVRMDGSFLEFSGTLPKWGTMSGGELRAQPQLEPFIDESGWQLLPTPTANLWMGYDYTTACKFKGKKTTFRPSGTRLSQFLNNCESIKEGFTPGTKNLLNPLLLELMMGFPEQWTEIDASETPSSPSSSTKSSGQ